MSYTHTVKIKLPVAMAAMADIAAAVGRALDPDTGGDKSFSRDVTGADAEGLPIFGDTISTSTPCTEAFATQAMYMLTHPEALHAAVSADYAARWVDMTPPTLAECEQFCLGVIVPDVTQMHPQLTQGINFTSIYK